MIAANFDTGTGTMAACKKTFKDALAAGKPAAGTKGAVPAVTDATQITKELKKAVDTKKMEYLKTSPCAGCKPASFDQTSCNTCQKNIKIFTAKIVGEKVCHTSTTVNIDTAFEKVCNADDVIQAEQEQIKETNEAAETGVVDAMKTCMDTANALSTGKPAAIKACMTATAMDSVAGALGKAKCTLGEETACQASATSAMACACVTNADAQDFVKGGAIKSVGDYLQTCDQVTSGAYDSAKATVCDDAAKAAYLTDAGLASVTPAQWKKTKADAAKGAVGEYMSTCVKAATDKSGRDACKIAGGDLIAKVKVVDATTITAKDKLEELKKGAAGATATAMEDCVKVAANADLKKGCASTAAKDAIANALGKAKCGTTEETACKATTAGKKACLCVTDQAAQSGVKEAAVSQVKSKVESCLAAAKNKATNAADAAAVTERGKCIKETAEAAVLATTGKAAGDLKKGDIPSFMKDARQDKISDDMSACVAELMTDDATTRKACRDGVAKKAYNELKGNAEGTAVAADVLRKDVEAAAKKKTKETTKACAEVATAISDAAASKIAKRACIFTDAKAEYAKNAGVEATTVDKAAIMGVVRDAAKDDLSSTLQTCVSAIPTATTGAPKTAALKLCRDVEGKAALATSLSKPATEVKAEDVLKMTKEAGAAAVKDIQKGCMEAATNKGERKTCFDEAKVRAGDAMAMAPATDSATRTEGTFTSLDFEELRSKGASTEVADVAKACKLEAACDASTLATKVIDAYKKSYGSKADGSEVVIDNTDINGKVKLQKVVKAAKVSVVKGALEACMAENSDGTKPTPAAIKTCMKTAAVASGFDELEKVATGAASLTTDQKTARFDRTVAKAMGESVCTQMRDCAKTTGATKEGCKTKAITFAKTFVDPPTDVDAKWLKFKLMKCRASIRAKAVECKEASGDTAAQAADTQCAASIASATDTVGASASEITNAGGLKREEGVETSISAAAAGAEAYAACKDDGTAANTEAACETHAKTAYVANGGNVDAAKWTSRNKKKVVDLGKAYFAGVATELTTKTSIDFGVAVAGACSDALETDVAAVVKTACVADMADCTVTPVEAITRSGTNDCLVKVELKSAAGCTDDTTCDAKAAIMAAKTITTTTRRRRRLAATTTTSATTTEESTASTPAAPTAAPTVSAPTTASSSAVVSTRSMMVAAIAAIAAAAMIVA